MSCISRFAAVLLPLALLSGASPSVNAGAGPAECRLDPETGARQCCRVCSRGKTCGNSCIARHLTCHRGRGCACDAGDGGSGGSARPSSSPGSRPHPAAATAIDRVREAQQLLNRLGYDVGTPDGILGTRTRDALRRFQRDHDLEPDGVPGDATMARLRQEAARQ